MTDPIGQGSFKGLGVPLYGESVIRQQNSSNAIITLMHSTANTGRLLMGIDYKVEGDLMTSVLTDLAVFDIDADGGFRAISGTTIKMELNSSGLFAGTNKVIDTSGGLSFTAQATVDISSDGTTAITLLAANAGKLHMVSTGTYSSIVISLPTSATGLGIAPGMYWDIFSNTTAASVVDIASIGANTAAAASSERILVHNGSTNSVETSGAITHDTSGPFWVRVMCLTTGGAPVYTVSNFMGRNGPTTATYLGIAAGSTALS